jgi:hypothetical protein
VPGEIGADREGAGQRVGQPRQVVVVGHRQAPGQRVGQRGAGAARRRGQLDGATRSNEGRVVIAEIAGGAARDHQQLQLARRAGEQRPGRGGVPARAQIFGARRQRDGRAGSLGEQIVGPAHRPRVIAGDVGRGDGGREHAGIGAQRERALVGSQRRGRVAERVGQRREPRVDLGAPGLQLQRLEVPSLRAAEIARGQRRVAQPEPSRDQLPSGLGAVTGERRVDRALEQPRRVDRAQLAEREAPEGEQRQRRRRIGGRRALEVTARLVGRGPRIVQEHLAQQRPRQRIVGRLGHRLAQIAHRLVDLAEPAPRLAERQVRGGEQRALTAGGVDALPEQLDRRVELTQRHQRAPVSDQRLGIAGPELQRARERGRGAIVVAAHQLDLAEQDPRGDVLGLVAQERVEQLGGAGMIAGQRAIARGVDLLAVAVEEQLVDGVAGLARDLGPQRAQRVGGPRHQPSLEPGGSFHRSVRSSPRPMRIALTWAICSAVAACSSAASPPRFLRSAIVRSSTSEMPL